MKAQLALLVLALVALFSVVAFGQGLGTTVLCSEVACSDGWICQNACSSWCGLNEPTEARPVCNPKSNTGDAPPPTVPSDRCAITDCGFRSVDFVACPQDGTTYGYKYVGSSCVRQTDGTCAWELAECQVIPTGPCGIDACGPEPAPPQGDQINCSGNFVNTTAHYECTRDNLGQCRHVWVPCQVGCLPGWVDSFIPAYCNPLPCDEANLPAASVDCDPNAIKGCLVDYCGGCNRRYYDANFNEICISQTRTCSNVLCKADYRCYESNTLGSPYCQNTLTCDNIRCGTGQRCEMTSSGPTCAIVPQNFVLNCDTVQCASFHNCVNDANGLATCIPFSGPCDQTGAECATKPRCWDNITVASGGTCSRLASGKCTWTGTTCPLQPNPPPTNPAGDNNCLVDAWSAWSCSATTCGGSGVNIRTRVVTQAATGTGQVCPELIARGTTCTRTCTNPPPPPITPIGGSTCADFPGCTEEIDNKCASPFSTAVCTSGTWVITGNVNAADLSFVGCNTQINGNFVTSATTNVRVHACGKITVSGTATLSGRLSLDVYNVNITTGTRVVAISAQSVTGTFGSAMVTGFSVADGSLPFRPGYTNTQAHVDFGTTVPAPTTTTTGSTIVPTVVASTTSSIPPPTTTTAPPPTTSTTPPPTTSTTPPPTTATITPPSTTTSPPPTTTVNVVPNSAASVSAGLFVVVAVIVAMF